MRSYRQFCALARALDLVGERWTLLVVRELLLGPRRFKDLLHGLPGMGPNLLARRLRRLEAEGLVARGTLPPPAGSRVYELTERGRALDEAVVALARWGMAPIAPPQPGDHRNPAWYALALRAAFRPEVAGNVREDYELRIADVTFHLHVRDGRVEARQGPAPEPAVVVEVASVESFLATLSGEREPENEEVEGDRTAVRRFRAAFALPRRPSSTKASRRRVATSAGGHRMGSSNPR